MTKLIAAVKFARLLRIRSSTTASAAAAGMLNRFDGDKRLQRVGLLDACPYSTIQNLPLFPVPPLNQTLNKFLFSVKPLLAPEKYEHACQLVEKFGCTGGIGEKLQNLLETKAKNTINWLEEWWLNVAYLEYRYPVAIHVNPGVFTPSLSFHGQDQQLWYSAKLISLIVEFKTMLDTATLPVDRLGNNELCMKQFYRILGCCRIPGPKKDDVLIYPGGHPDAAKHINVLHNNHIFSLDVYGLDGHALTTGQLYVQLKKIIATSEMTALPVGVLTTEHRDVWYKAFAQLNKDETNRQSLSNIQQSIFVLCLDKSCLRSNNNHNNNNNNNTAFLNQVEHGGGSELNSGNRWFDKILQVMVSPDGAIGFNYEHSAAEGPPIIQLVDYCYSKLKGDISFSDSSLPQKTNEPQKLKFNINNDIKTIIESAVKSFDLLISDLELVYFNFDEFGKNFLKTKKTSPDAFIQIAFQLAYYRLHKKCVPTYESGSLRKFQHGRTDTIRSCSVSSVAYCQAMQSNNKTTKEKIQLFKSAITGHRNYTDQVINGQGIDRHLLGLKLIALENNIEIPDLLKDPVYENTCNWKISTSQVPSKSGGLLCFAPVVTDGYGICYNPMDDQLLFSVSSWRSCEETDAKKFLPYLEQSLQDGRRLLEDADSLSKL